MTIIHRKATAGTEANAKVAQVSRSCIITLSLVNEANPGRVWGATPRSEKMYREKFAEWKKSNPDKSFEQFISFRAVTRFEEMKAALREIGCGTLLSDH